MSKGKKAKPLGAAVSESVGGSQRWALVPDEQDSRRLSWEWDSQASDDIDEVFSRVGSGQGTWLDHELFDACMLDRFITRVDRGESVEPWILEFLADRFAKMLLGGDWNDEIHLPGRPMAPVRTPKEQRALEIYCDVTNTVNGGGIAVTEAIESVAAARAVSYETARSDYYRWKKWFSEKGRETQKDQDRTGE